MNMTLKTKKILWFNWLLWGMATGFYFWARIFYIFSSVFHAKNPLYELGWDFCFASKVLLLNKALIWYRYTGMAGRMFFVCSITSKGLTWISFTLLWTISFPINENEFKIFSKVKYLVFLLVYCFRILTGSLGFPETAKHSFWLFKIKVFYGKSKKKNKPSKVLKICIFSLFKEKIEVLISSLCLIGWLSLEN